ncbi:MAG: nitrous oxide reductase family maturation protein NosD [Promethearchaeota archaeon]
MASFSADEYTHFYSPNTKAARFLRIDQSYVIHNAININGNADFHSQASLYGWNGTGIVTDPYVITGYNFTTNSSFYVSISNTDIYFRISNCLIQNKQNANDTSFYEPIYGIYLESVTHGIIVDNIIDSNYTYVRNQQIYWFKAIYLYESFNNEINNNLIKECTTGVDLLRSESNLIKNNKLNDCLYAIRIIVSSSNTIYNNTLEGTYNVYYRSMYGIDLSGSSEHNHIYNNRIKVFDIGVRILSADQNNFTGNVIVQNNDGIYCYPDGDKNIFQNNLIAHNSWYAMYFKNNLDGITASIPSSNIIRNNDFLHNNIGGESQVKDTGSQNVFDGNYWSDIIVFHNNTPTLTNPSYFIEADRDQVQNQDTNPSTQFFTPLTKYHFPAPFIQTYLLYTMFDTSAYILWDNLTDFRGTDVYYSIYYSPTETENWTPLRSNFSESQYLWNTVNLTNGYYQIKIMAHYDGNFTIETISDIFCIYHIPVPSFIEPKNTVLRQTVLIEWQRLVDIREDIFDWMKPEYSIAYSYSNQNNWIWLITNTTSTSYQWNTELLSNNYYQLKIIARFIGGLESKNVSQIYQVNNFAIGSFNVIETQIIVYGIIGTFLSVSVLCVFLYIRKKIRKTQTSCSQQVSKKLYKS